MRRLSSAEAALFLVPLALVPLAIYGQRWKIAVTPTPNLYTNTDLGSMSALLPSRDGKWMVTVASPISSQQQPRFSKWDARTGSLVRRFGIFRFTSNEAVLSADNRTLGYRYGGWKGDRVVLFDTANGKEKRQFIESRDVEGGHSDFALNNEIVALHTYDDVRLSRISDGVLVGKLRYRPRNYYPKRLISSL